MVPFTNHDRGAHVVMLTVDDIIGAVCKILVNFWRFFLQDYEAKISISANSDR